MTWPPTRVLPKHAARQARADRKRRDRLFDEAESAAVRGRSGRVCELLECVRYACQLHHMLGGNGVRGRGRSACREFKLHLCQRCHDAITRRDLVLDWPAESLEPWRDVVVVAVKISIDSREVSALS